MTTEANRAAFEAWYAEDATRQGVPLTQESVVKLRKKDGYGDERVMLNGKWEGWQASRKAALAAPQAKEQATFTHEPASTWFEDLKFVQRVLESHATEHDRLAALESVRRARKSIHRAALAAPQAKEATEDSPYINARNKPDQKTLRDCFADSAMGGMMSRSESDEWSAKEIARGAYRQADAMIAEREVGVTK